MQMIHCSISSLPEVCVVLPPDEDALGDFEVEVPFVLLLPFDVLFVVVLVLLLMRVTQLCIQV